MARLDEKNVASVKKTVSTAGPTGGILSAFDIAQSKKLVQNVGGKKAADAQVGALMGINKTAAAPAKGKGGKLTKVSTPVKAGATLKNALKRGDQSSATQVMKEKLTGKPAAAAKQEELKMSTYQLPSAVQIGPHSYNYEQTMDALKKTRQTYGEGSDEYKALADAVGYISEKANYGMMYKKPDLRKDAGKSYVDTAQAVYQNVRDRIPTLGRNENIAVRLLNQFGVKGARSLAKDKDAVEGLRNK